MRLKELVKKIRSKNAGPFLLTIDIFPDWDAFLKASDIRITNEVKSPLNNNSMPDIKIKLENTK